MRTTINLDDDLLDAARALAERRGQPIGVVLSDLIRRGLAPAPTAAVRNGLRLFPPRPAEPPVTPELVRRLLDESE